MILSDCCNNQVKIEGKKRPFFFCLNCGEECNINEVDEIEDESALWKAVKYKLMNI